MTERQRFLQVHFRHDQWRTMPPEWNTSAHCRLSLLSLADGRLEFLCTCAAVGQAPEILGRNLPKRLGPAPNSLRLLPFKDAVAWNDHAVLRRALDQLLPSLQKSLGPLLLRLSLVLA